MNKAEKSAHNRAYRIANKERIEANRAARRAGVGDAIRRCSVPGCGRIYDANGLCARHYMRARRNGDPLLILQEQIHDKTPAEKVRMFTKRSSGCWTWTANKNLKGYGLISANGRRYLAHRLAYELECGPIPEGASVLHRCDNPACVRPSHLWLGTIAENNADMAAKGRARNTPRSGAANGLAKLTDDVVREIRNSTDYLWVLANRYGVTESTVSSVRTGKTWRHVK
jgi:hypothetical protein